MLAAQLSMEYGLACSTAGGTHHAFPGYGSGFCMLNDLAVTAKDMIHNKIVSKILIVDLDVHQVLSSGYYNTVEPLVSDHPKGQDLVVACGRWSLTRVEPEGSSSRNRSNTSAYSKRIYCIHFPSSNTSSARLNSEVV